MSDFLMRLAQRQLGQIASVEPRVRELYAPVSAAPPVPIVGTAAVDSMTTPGISQPARPLVTDASAMNIRAATALTARLPEARPESGAEQRSEADSDTGKISPRVPETVNADIASWVMQRASVEPLGLAMSSPIELVTETPDSLPLLQDSRAQREFADRIAVRPLVGARVTTAEAAPPRLGTAPTERAPALELWQAGAEPPVHVTIGRIEVTAVTAAPTQRRAAMTRKPPMSLDDYLARRQRREP